MRLTTSPNGNREKNSERSKGDLSSSAACPSREARTTPSHLSGCRSQDRVPWSSPSRSLNPALLCAALVAGLCASASAQWVEFADETSTRLDATPALGASDSQEKDYAWGDVDQDGDIDLVVVRKQPFTSAGRRVNVLLLNENGVLTDRTAEYASASDVPGDLGFQTATNDRDVQLVDVDLDGWLDIVTVVTLSDGQPKHISHPRIYINLGESAGTWQGFEYQDARIPQLAGLAPGGTPHAPRFCSLGVGDVTGDGAPDLYFGDYDSGPPQTLDFNDRLLVNDGNGFFADETTTRFVNLISVGGSSYTFYQSAFGTASIIADVNDDGVADIIKDTALNAPQYVGVSYNDPADEGTFSLHEAIYTISPYFVQIGDLNNDGLLDLFIGDDGQDRVLRNTGVDFLGRADFTTVFPTYIGGSDPGFPGNSFIADLDNDGWNDVISDNVDVDIPGCDRRTYIFHNLGTPNISLQSTGIYAWTPLGVHDTAVFDIDGDGWLDLVQGTCSGTKVWMNVPPGGLTFDYPLGLPAAQGCDSPQTVWVQIGTFGTITPTAGTFHAYHSLDGAPFVEIPATDLGANLYELELPPQPVATHVRFYFTHEAASITFSDPPGAPATTYELYVADELATTVEEFETTAPGWTVDSAASGGAWELAVPNATTFGGAPVAPGEDASPAPGDVQAFVTGNGPPGGVATSDDVDGGPNRLLSPLIDLDGTDGTISFSLWYVNIESDPSQVDELLVEISNDAGTSWQPVLTLTGQNPSWTPYTIQVSDYVTPTAQIQVRFTADDDPANSLVEAGVDSFVVSAFACIPPEPTFVRGDVNQDAAVDLGDPVFLLAFIFNDGAAPGCLDGADVNDDSSINIADAIFALEAQFGGAVTVPAPFPGCDVDPTPDSLTCDTVICP